jgi:hypothetical protein
MNVDLRTEFASFDRYDLRNAFDLVMGPTHRSYPEKLESIMLKYIHSMDSESFSALKYFNFNEEVFNWLYPYLKITNFNEALQLYFNLNSDLGKLTLEVYGLERNSLRLPSKKLPIQAKLFRD